MPPPVEGEAVDPYVAELILGTHGNLYKHLSGGMSRYPIPDFPLQRGNGELLLDIGCNWGRWTIAAAQRGYRPIGIDPSFEAIVAARRIARQLGDRRRATSSPTRGSCRSPDETFDVVFSYGVLQHFSKSDVALSVDEIRACSKRDGYSWVQMPNALGALNVVRLAQRRFREGDEFEVRYWRPSELKRVFGRIGPTELSTDGFFTLNPQKRDLDLLPRRFRALVRVSEGLKAVGAPTTLADSVNIRSAAVAWPSSSARATGARCGTARRLRARGTSTRSWTACPCCSSTRRHRRTRRCGGRRRAAAAGATDGIDPFVQEVIGATCGSLYEHLIADLPEYPIPELRLPPGEGRAFLEVGSNWGRWCVAAARRATRPSGSTRRSRACRRRVASPSSSGSTPSTSSATRGTCRSRTRASTSSSRTASSSTSRSDDALAAFEELGRVLKPGGESLIQMANLYGARSLWNQARERRFREPRTLFDVRYWGPRELRRRARAARRADRALGRRLLHAEPAADRPRALPRALPRGRAHVGGAAPRVETRQAADVRRGQRLRFVASWVAGSRRGRRRASASSSRRPRSRWRRSGSSSRTAAPCSTGSGASARTATSSSC